MKVALIHDWLTGMRGGEKVLEVFCEIFPQAHLFTLLHNPGSVSEIIERMPIQTSFLQKMPLIQSRYRYYLPFYSWAVENLDVHDYDLIISLSHCVAHGIIPNPSACHICYCFTPIRYAWDKYRDYFGHTRGLGGKLISVYLNRHRCWDVTASHRVDHFVAISKHVARRIHRYYRREADIIYPPVDCDRFKKTAPPGDFFLIVSALAPYKRIDIAVETFNQLGLPLVIIGNGPLEKRLRKQARNNISFLGWQPDEVLADHYARCKAFVFCGEEDFGITILEAHAAGKPVIAYRAGGALETVIEGETGQFFNLLQPDSLTQAIENFNVLDYNATKIRDRALIFDRAVFKKNIEAYVLNRYEEHTQGV
ncbi:glycosyltransferase [bacterium]|nr:glycosyltransferase [bacterium]